MDEPPRAVAIGTNGFWPYFRWSNQIAMGFGNNEPLHGVTSIAEVNGRTGLESDFWNSPPGFLKRFSADVYPGDIIIAKSGTNEIDGIGVIRGQYQFRTDTWSKDNSNRHARPVEWVVDFHELLGEAYDVSDQLDQNFFVPSTDVKQKDFGTLENLIMTADIPDIEEQWQNLVDAAKEPADPQLFVNQAEQYYGNFGDFVQSPVDEDKRKEIREGLTSLQLEAEAADTVKEVVQNLLGNDSLTLWGAKRRNAPTYDDLRPGDWVLHLKRQTGEIAAQRADVIFSDLSIEDRKSLSELFFGKKSYPLLWFSTTEVLNGNGIEAYLDAINWDDLSINHETTGFQQIDQDIVEQSGGIEEVIQSVTGSELPEPSPSETARRLANVDHAARARQAVGHLIAGKNVLFYGPPGSGKTRMAEQLMEQFSADASQTETAHAEWTQYEVVGGPSLDSSGNFRLQWGHIPRAAGACVESLADDGKPTWLLIDELNRANLDSAFGDVFTQLDLDYRGTDNPLEIGDPDAGEGGEYKQQPIPYAFRLLATMNTSDQAQLFALGYAFRRRFAFIDVPSLLSETEDENIARAREPVPEVPVPELTARIENFAGKLPEIVAGKFRADPELENDTPLSFPDLETDLDTETGVEEALARVHTKSDVTVIDVLLHIASAANQIDGIELGQGLAIDAIKYVAVNAAVFPTKADWRIVDEAIASYYLPQFDVIMPELRKEEVTGSAVRADSEHSDVTEKSINTQLEEYGDLLREYDLPKSASRLDRAREERSVL